MRVLFLMLLSSVAYAQDMVTAVTNVNGSMSTVTIRTDVDTAVYSRCNNLTPYTYPWHVTDDVNISVNEEATAYTINDLTTAALAVCIVKTPV